MGVFGGHLFGHIIVICGGRGNEGYLLLEITIKRRGEGRGRRFPHHSDLLL